MCTATVLGNHRFDSRADHGRDFYEQLLCADFRRVPCCTSVDGVTSSFRFSRPARAGGVADGILSRKRCSCHEYGYRDLLSGLFFGMLLQAHRDSDSTVGTSPSSALQRAATTSAEENPTPDGTNRKQHSQSRVRPFPDTTP